MMNIPLTVPGMLEHAEKYFSQKEITSRTAKVTSNLTYAEVAVRTRRLSSALKQLGLRKGDRVGTFAWNHHRHLEAYFGIPGMGGVLHTINIRLSSEHISYIINHAEDKVLLIDAELVPLIEKVQPKLKTVQAFIIMTDEDVLPETKLRNVYHYEEFLVNGDENFEFVKDIDENDPAGMCFTSATTGNPKGVVYSHRGIVLHSMALGLADSTAISESDVMMPVVPMFHVNAWGLPFASVWFGAEQVLPGPMPTPAILAELIDDHRVTLAAGVPTIWIALLKELENGSYDTSSLRGILCGGSAAPKSMIHTFEEKYKVPFIHAYGMTESTPLVTLSRLKSYQESCPEDVRLDIRSKQGYVVPGVEMKVIGKDGEVEWNSKEMGELLLRGNWVADEYYKDERTKEAFRDGWLYTGDVATVDQEGNVKIIDRTKDLIKSGGEWISSVDLENALMAHETVFEATVIAVPHREWQERPLACVVLKDEMKDKVTKDELMEFLRPQFAKWWLPDDIVFLDEIPKTSVGKFLKRTLRDQLKDYLETTSK
ncbi:long-chain fatty acid--CoA ligase [Pseudalkalibacillus salsuginis]|uniref:long-chain fatty acid--CoA ligase n=1 Tax=Pseudalkalibacillus salsuginis TaxID=2910972 RepID=UPI001F332C95|nr:long-chain fatty acid--CoA ligase [Pseudalkalibacillus salsuginis]MCF6408955.1 long-chain fatty acid--CoA ligase [Pseudalkalibacillus salsuginis]